MSYEEIVQNISVVLDTLRPVIIMDGGDIDFVRYENGIVSVRLRGACVGCPMSMYTLKMGIESALKEKIPAVTEVVSVD
jgi:Fe-S cluster biogenesis protein NfuA